MRNLKRALSMALASVMVLGLMVVGASAASYEDFTDKDEIVNTEAVNTMVSLGVISGKDDGSYDPTGSLTRAEACTLIARMLGGGKDPVLGSNIKSTFTDTQGHWAETYIAYCANLGIIVGVGDGSFNPDGTLTGSAAAKMVLCALGYKPEFEGIGGANWELATNTLATKIDLYAGLEDLNPSATITRDDVAQLIYNGVQAQEVEYRNLQGDYSGTLYAQDQGSMLSNRFGVVKVTGVVEANEYFGLNQAATKEGKTQLNVRESVSYGGGSYEGVALYNLTTSADLLGKEVVIYVKPASKLNPNPADDAVLGDPIVTTKNTIYTTQDKLVNDNSKSNDITKALKNEGLTLPNDAKAYVNYAANTDADTKSEFAALTGRGYTSTFIDNTGDGKVDVVLSYQPAFGKVTVYSESGDGKITVNNLSSTNVTPALANKVADDVKGFENVAKDDYVFYTYIAADATYYVEKAEGTTVTVSATKTATDRMDSTVTADGTTYKLSALASTTDVAATSGAQAGLTDAVEIGESAVFYLDDAGYVVYVDEVTSTTNYLVATDSAVSGDFDDSLIAKVILSDGTSATVTVSKLNDKNLVAGSPESDEIAVADDLLATNKVYSYTVNSDGEYELKEVTTVTATGITNNKPTVASGLIANTTTPIIVKDSGSSATLYTGINAVPSRTSATVLGVADSTTNVAKVIFGLNGTGVAADDSYMYFLSTTPTVTKDSDGNNVYTYDVVRDGEITTIAGKGATITGLSTAGLYKATFDGDKVSSVTTDSRTVSLNLVTVAADGVLSNGTNSYYYSDSTVVYEIADDGTATESSIENIVVKQDDGSVVSGDDLKILLDKDGDEATDTALYVFIMK